MTATATLTRVEIDRLGEAIADIAAHIDAATHQLLTQIRVFDASEGWGLQGALSCAHWMAWRIGTGLGAAREQVRVARALGELPLLDEALRRGELSYSKLRAMTRVATPANEEMLLTMARNTTAAQLEKLCRLYRPIQAGDLDAREIEEGRRYVTSRPTDDGMVSIRIRVLPDEAARIMAAFDALAAHGSRADGAVALAEAGLRGADATSDMPIRSPIEVVVHISAEGGSGVTSLGDGLPPETCRRLLCDAGVVPILEDSSGSAIDVGRKTRTIPAALRRALDARDGGCRFPGCGLRRFVDAHHIDHWIDGGETSLANSVLLCRRHHRYLHEHGFSITREAGELAFHDPTGRVVASAPARAPLPGPAFDHLDQRIRASGSIVDASSNLPGWDGLPVDYDLCVSALSGLDGRG